MQPETPTQSPNLDARRIVRQEIKGVLNPKFVRGISFVIISFSLVICTALCVWGIWQEDPSHVVWRTVATLIVVITATAIFTVVNEKLG